MTLPLMPKATAVWLVENTTLTFQQIAKFCGLHELEIQGIADGEVAISMQGLDPVANGQISKAEIQRCEGDSTATLQLLKPDIPMPTTRSKGPRYTPIAKRGDKPDAIAWVLKNHPELSMAQISRLIGTTKPTIEAVRDRTHWNSQNITARHPVQLGLCSYDELNAMVSKAKPGTTAILPSMEEEEPEPEIPSLEAFGEALSSSSAAAQAHSLFSGGGGSGGSDSSDGGGNTGG